MDEILQITIILIFSMIATVISRRINIPEVVGQMLIGIVLAPTVLGWIHGGETIEVMSEIGVILLMFLAGLESDTKTLKNNLLSSVLVAVTGLIVPLLIFGLIFFYTGKDMSTSFFCGIVFAATSVSITVKVLQEYGMLSSKAGNIILGAAVVDDILAILTLSIFTSLSSGSVDLWKEILIQIIFFSFLVVIYKLIPKLWKYVDRLPIYAKNTTMALIICLGLSLLADKVGVSSVIGSFFAGVAISHTDISDKIGEYISAIGYVIFIPIFFVSIAISVNFDILFKHPIFIILLTLVAILTKLVPSYFMGRVTKLDYHSSLLVGTGMVSRGEMALIVSQIGLSTAIITTDTYSELVIIVILTTLVAPFLIKMAINMSNKESKK